MLEFQYPEGHSSGFHEEPEAWIGQDGKRFSTPKGIPLVSTLIVKIGKSNQTL